MTKYCLDTNIISLLTNNLWKGDDDFIKQQKIKNKISEKNIDDLYITEITKLELISWMNEKIYKIHKNHTSDDDIKKIYPDITSKTIRKSKIEVDFIYDDLSSNEKEKLTQFSKQNKLLKIFEKQAKVLRLDDDSFLDYKDIIKMKSLKWKNYSDHSDLLIASICLSHDLVLITNNEKDFNLIEWLKVENWCT